MKKIFVGLFLFFCLISCQNNYEKFHDEKNIQNQETQEIQKSLSGFSLSQIQTLSGVFIHPTPDTKFLETLVDKIDKSQKKVYVEVYIFTEKRLREALIRAHKRGVDVKVLLEKNVYMAPQLNKEAFSLFQKAGINVSYGDSEDYSLNHTKMMFIDDEFFVSTWNYSYSTFKYNREFFIYGTNWDLYQTLEKIFEADFSGNKKNVYHSNLVLSPFYSRFKMEYLITHAQKKLEIYAHNFWDKNMEKIIIEAKKRWVEVDMIFPSDKKVDSNKEEIARLREQGIQIVQSSKPEIHAKVIIADEKYAYVGSINFSAPSMDQNREIGILLSNPELLEILRKTFLADKKWFQKNKN